MLGELPLSQTSGTSTKPHYSHLFYFVAFSVLTHCIEFVLAHRDEEPEFVEWGYGGMGSVNNSSQGAGELIRLLVSFWFFWFFGWCHSQPLFAFQRATAPWAMWCVIDRGGLDPLSRYLSNVKRDSLTPKNVSGQPHLACI